jgi:hypothetical protein
MLQSQWSRVTHFVQQSEVLGAVWPSVNDEGSRSKLHVSLDFHLHETKQQFGRHISLGLNGLHNRQPSEVWTCLPQTLDRLIRTDVNESKLCGDVCCGSALSRSWGAYRDTDLIS